MKHLRILWLVCALAALVGCQSKSPSGAASGASAAAASSPVIATVNGKPITRAFYEYYIERATGGKTSSDLTPQQRSIALDNLVRAEVIEQQALHEGLEKQPDTAALLKLMRINVLEQAVSNKYFAAKPPTEAELQAEYQSEVEQLPKTEYHAAHILVTSEPQAEAVIRQLRAGANFAALARQDSIDSSKTNGGDLGWFTLDHMVKPFAAAVAQLKPGQYTTTPVHTQYGWHVIKLLGTRPVTPPAFAQVESRMKQVVEAKEFRSYTDALLGKANVVTYLNPWTDAERSGQKGALKLPSASSAPASAPANAPANGSP